MAEPSRLRSGDVTAGETVDMVGASQVDEMHKENVNSNCVLVDNFCCNHQAEKASERFPNRS